MTRLIRTVQRLALPLDTAERHALVARLAGEPDSILDVGGTPGTLGLFLPRASITTANVEPPADILLDGAAGLPVAGDAFDVVTSIDVLEHLPRESRADHIRELVRVARRRVVVCCPLGTPQHSASEHALHAWLERETGAGHRFLAEHLKLGLPTESELRALGDAARGSWQLSCNGDFRRTEALFRSSILARSNPVSALHYVVRRLATRPQLTLSPSAAAFANRAFLVGDLNGPSRADATRTPGP